MKECTPIAGGLERPNIHTSYRRAGDKNIHPATDACNVVFCNDVYCHLSEISVKLKNRNFGMFPNNV